MQKHKLFLNKLGLTTPIIQAPMANVSTVELALEVSKNGGLGSIALSPFDVTKQTAAIFENISTFRLLAGQSAPLNCNFFCFDPKEQHEPTKSEVFNWKELYLKATNVSETEIEEASSDIYRAVVSFKEFEEVHPDKCAGFLDQLISLKIGVVSFHFGIPSMETITRLQKGGVLVFGSVTLVAEARDMVNNRVDALVCQGYEAGGHRGNYMKPPDLDENLSTRALFKQVKKYTESLENAPFLIPSGGIVDGSDAMDYISDGAAAVQLGTIFIPTQESAAPDFIAECVKQNKSIPTIMSPLISGRNARTLATPFIESLTREHKKHNFSLPLFGYSTTAYRKFASGRAEFGFFLAGQNYPLVQTVKTASEVMATIKEDMKNRAAQFV